MTRAVERALAVVAVVLTGAFLSAVAGGGGWISRGRAPGTPDAGYFHAGKTPPVSVQERGCRSTGCHVGVPHAKDRTLAAFRNMHVRFVDCVVCHGRDSRGSWTVGVAPPAAAGGGDGRLRNRWTIAAPVPTGDRDRMHAILGVALSCRACHSEEGHRDIAAKGGRDLPAGFDNPVALRMTEEGAKQWIPDTIR